MNAGHQETGIRDGYCSQICLNSVELFATSGETRVTGCYGDTGGCMAAPRDPVLLAVPLQKIKSIDLEVCSLEKWAAKDSAQSGWLRYAK